MEKIFFYSLKYFLVINALAQAPFFASLVKHFAPERQQFLLRRELFLAFVTGVFFLVIGEPFLRTLQVSTSTVQICGGLILFFIALDILFPHQAVTRSDDPTKEPFLVPIAIPLLSGPSLMTMLMFSTRQEPNIWVLAAALGIAYLASSVVVLGAPAVCRLLGERGLAAVERLMGMLLIMLSVNMLTDGFRKFIQEL